MAIVRAYKDGRIDEWDTDIVSMTIGNKEEIPYIPKDVAEMAADLTELDITKNGIYTPTDGYDGFSSVDVNVELNTKSLTITRNGTYRAADYDCEAFSSVSVECPTGAELLNLRDITINKNGKYSPGEYDGFSEATVKLITDVWWEESDDNFDSMIFDSLATYVCYLGEIHKLGGAEPKAHYVYRDRRWQTALELPFDFVQGRAYLNAEGLHILGSTVADNDFYAVKGYDSCFAHYIYKYSDVENPVTHEIERVYRWEESNIRLPGVCMFNVAYSDRGYLHLLGGREITVEEQEETRVAVIGANNRTHYVARKTANWATYKPLPIDSVGDACTIFKNKICVFSGTTAYMVDVRFDGTSIGQSGEWETIDCPIAPQFAFACDDGRAEKLHLLRNTTHLSYNGKFWKADETLENSIGSCEQMAIQVDLSNQPDFTEGVIFFGNIEEQVIIELNQEE